MVTGGARRACRRYYRRHPWQAVLTILGVALGVAVVVAVDLAIESAQRAFQLSTDSILGRATHQIVGGPAGLDDRLYTRLRVELGVRGTAPVIEAYGTSANETLHLLGVDPLADSSLRDHATAIDSEALQRLLLEPGAALLTKATAQRLGLSIDNPFTVAFAGRSRELILAGVIEADASARAAIDGLLITDIATAQELLDFIGRLSWIDLVVPDGAPGDALFKRLASILPASAAVVTSSTRANSTGQMTRAFRTNLTAMSLLALLVGMFLIYNTMTFAVVQRRTLIGMLRVLGVTRAEIFQVVLIEGLIVGVAGVAVGLVAGAGLGLGMVRLVTRTINDLYFVVTVNELLIEPLPLIKAAVLGLAASAASVLVPAWDAARAAPRQALSRSQFEYRVRVRASRLAIAGALLMLGATAMLALPTRSLVIAFAALFVLTLGYTLIAPAAVSGLTCVALASAGRFLSLQARHAIRGVGASLSRTGIAIAALMLALATAVGVGVMVASFRTSVVDWLETTLRADIYIRAPSLMSSRTPAHLDSNFIARIRTLPGISDITTARSVDIESNRGLTHIFALDVPRSYAARFSLTAGNPEKAFADFFESRAVLVSEPYAYRHQVKPGDRIELRTDHGLINFPVAGVYRDYGSEQGEIAMIRRLYDTHFDDPHISAAALFLKPGVPVSTVLAAVRAAVRPGEEVIVNSNRELRTASIKIFDRTFTITNVLRLLAVLAAFIGILSALMALTLERARELGILRALGFTPGQIQALVAVQTGFMGLLAGVLALPLGALLAELLIHVINRRAFGWSMDTVFAPIVFGETVALAIGSALIAGLYPGWKMSHVAPAAILREE
jgi:putative ABC transport system permease protein